MNLIPSRVCASQSFFWEHLFEQHCLLSTFNIRNPIGKCANAVVFLYDAVILYQGVLTPRAWLDLILPAQCPVISDNHTNQKSKVKIILKTKPNWPNYKNESSVRTCLLGEIWASHAFCCIYIHTAWFCEYVIGNFHFAKAMHGAAWNGRA